MFRVWSLAQRLASVSQKMQEVGGMKLLVPMVVGRKLVRREFM